MYIYCRCKVSSGDVYSYIMAATAAKTGVVHGIELLGYLLVAHIKAIVS